MKYETPTMPGLVVMARRYTWPTAAQQTIVCARCYTHRFALERSRPLLKLRHSRYCASALLRRPCIVVAAVFALPFARLRRAQPPGFDGAELGLANSTKIAPCEIRAGRILGSCARHQVAGLCGKCTPRKAPVSGSSRAPVSRCKPPRPPRPRCTEAPLRSVPQTSPKLKGPSGSPIA